MSERLTLREREIVGRVARTFPESTITAEIQEIPRPGGPAAAVHISLDRGVSVDLERARIAWQPESPQLLAEAVEARLELLNLERFWQRVARMAVREPRLLLSDH